MNKMTKVFIWGAFIVSSVVSAVCGEYVSAEIMNKLTTNETESESESEE